MSRFLGIKRSRPPRRWPALPARPSCLVLTVTSSLQPDASKASPPKCSDHLGQRSADSSNAPIALPSLLNPPQASCAAHSCVHPAVGSFHATACPLLPSDGSHTSKAIQVSEPSAACIPHVGVLRIFECLASMLSNTLKELRIRQVVCIGNEVELACSVLSRGQVVAITDMSALLCPQSAGSWP